MTAGVILSRCTTCDWQGLPRRLWCPACGSTSMGEVRVTHGTVSGATTVRRAPGVVARSSEPVRLGEVRADGGGAIVARLSAGVVAGGRVELHDDLGVAAARPVAERTDV